MSTFKKCQEYKDVYRQIHGVPMRWDMFAERIAEVEEAFYAKIVLDGHRNCQAEWIVKVAEHLHPSFADGGSNTLPYEIPSHMEGAAEDYVFAGEHILTEEDVVWATVLSCTSEYVRLRKVTKGEPFDMFLGDRDSRDIILQCMFNPFYRLFLQCSSSDDLPSWSALLTEEEKEYFRIAYLEALPVFLGEQATAALAAEAERKKREEEKRSAEPPYRRYATR